MLRKLLFLVFIFCYLFSVADVITVNKPGGLEKAIKKNKLTEATELILEGKINLKDVSYLENLPGLKTLNFQNVELIPQNKKEDISKFTIPSLPNLESLCISDNFGNDKTIILGLLPNLKKLSTSNSIKLLNIQPHLLDYLEVYGEPGITYNKKIKTKILKVEDKEWLDKQNYYSKINWRDACEIECCILETTKSGDWDIILYHYDPKYPELIENCTIISSNGLKNYPGQYFILPSSIKQIENNAFEGSNIQTIEIADNQIASNIKPGINLPISIRVIVPQGSYNQFKQKISSPIYEKGRPHTFVYSPDKDGSLDAFLANGKINLVDTLKIVGKIPVNFNFKFLKNAENLRFIDLMEADIEIDTKTLKDEEHKYVKEAVDIILTNYYDSVEIIEDKYYDQVALFGLLNYLIGESANMNKNDANSGDIVAAIKSEFYSVLNKDLTEEFNTAKNSFPNEEIRKVHEEMINSLKLIGNFSDEVPSSIDEFSYINSKDWVKLTQAQSRQTISELGSKRGKKFSKDEIHSPQFVDVLSSIDPKYKYMRVWDGEKPDDFFLKRQRKQHILTTQERNQIINDLKLKINQLSKKKKLSETFSEIPNLHAVILKKNTTLDSNNVKYSIEFK